jgi:hypothetical protein
MKRAHEMAGSTHAAVVRCKSNQMKPNPAGSLRQGSRPRARFTPADPGWRSRMSSRQLPFDLICNAQRSVSTRPSHANHYAKRRPRPSQLETCKTSSEATFARSSTFEHTVLLLETLPSKVFTGRVSSFQGFFQLFTDGLQSFPGFPNGLLAQNLRLPLSIFQGPAF